jgi:Xaa-Pro dipeptidase
MFAMVLPREGEPAYITPGFEEERAREQIRFGDDIRRWEEDESPYKIVAGIFKDRGIRTGRIGFEETVRFFLFDGVRKEAPALQYVDATAVTAGCRMIKSPAEIALMQKANDVTIEAFKATVAGLHEGMTPAEFRADCAAAHQALGFSGGVMVNFGKYSAFPHGSTLPQELQKGDIVLMDGGCSVEGYRSDITRTLVFGDPSDRQREIWNIERKAQDAAFAAAQVGATCESVEPSTRRRGRSAASERGARAGGRCR